MITNKIQSYPELFEQWWVNKAVTHFECKTVEGALARLEPVVQALSDQFTTERVPGFGKYYEDEELLLAYGLFFFPQSYVRIQWSIAELICNRGWKPPEGRPLKILDLGAGLGAASFGTVDLIKSLYPDLKIEVDALDHAGTSLSWMRDMAFKLRSNAAHWNFEKKSLQERLFHGKESKRSWDLVIASFSLNELGFEPEAIADWIRSIFRHVESTGVLVIQEPALKETSIPMYQAREILRTDENIHIWGPCLHSQSCPVLESKTHWCHEVRAWKPPESLKYINRHLFRNIQFIKWSHWMISPSPAPKIKPEGTAFRLISPVGETNGKSVMTGCVESGEVRPLEIMHRYLSSKQKRALPDILHRGDLLSAQGLNPAGKSNALRFSQDAELKPISLNEIQMNLLDSTRES